jgi:hypothetical protein
MAKASTASSVSTFLQKSTNTGQTKIDFKESFEVMKPATMSGFRGMFGDAKLSDQEEKCLQFILNDYYQAEVLNEDRMNEDYQTLVRITSEIKAISNQSILLHGERIKRAQEVLKSYKEGAFTEWLISTYGNRQTPYSMLQYYDLYHALPEQARSLIENIPKKAAYTLASREGSIDRKIEIIQNYRGERQSDVILLIQKTFPTGKMIRRRRTSNITILDDVERLLMRIEQRKHYLSESDKLRLSILVERVSKVLE